MTPPERDSGETYQDPAAGARGKAQLLFGKRIMPRKTSFTQVATQSEMSSSGSRESGAKWLFTFLIVV